MLELIVHCLREEEASTMEQTKLRMKNTKMNHIKTAS